MATYRITMSTASTLANICTVAMERFTEHAKNLDAHSKCDPVEGEFITPAAAARLRDQFNYQAAQAQHLAQVFNAVERTGQIEVDAGMIEDFNAMGGNSS